MTVWKAEDNVNVCAHTDLSLFAHLEKAVINMPASSSVLLSTGKSGCEGNVNSQQKVVLCKKHPPNFQFVSARQKRICLSKGVAHLLTERIARQRWYNAGIWKHCDKTRSVQFVAHQLQ